MESTHERVKKGKPVLPTAPETIITKIIPIESIQQFILRRKYKYVVCKKTRYSSGSTTEYLAEKWKENRYPHLYWTHCNWLAKKYTKSDAKRLAKIHNCDFIKL